ncbi:MAG: peptidoglycan-binding protein [Polyangiales bacterium]
MQHVVRQGECLASIAHRHGFANWQAIWEHPANTDLRLRRPNPNVIHPGDVLFIPEREPITRRCATDRQHTFTVSRPRWRFRLKVADHTGEVLAGVGFALHVEGVDPIEGAIDSDGMIDVEVPPWARVGRLTVLGEEVTVQFGQLDPVSRVTGVQARLRNLGYDPGPIDGVVGARTRRALRRFQSDHGLDATGEPDAATRERLLAAHDADPDAPADEDGMEADGG